MDPELITRFLAVVGLVAVARYAAKAFCAALEQGAAAEEEVARESRATHITDSPTQGDPR